MFANLNWCYSWTNFNSTVIGPRISFLNHGEVRECNYREDMKNMGPVQDRTTREENAAQGFHS